MKNPNGYGSVYKLSDKRRRKPWAVRVTESWSIVDGKLKRNYKYLGYFETRKGYQSLAHVKAMLCHLYKYAIENDISDKDYAQFIDLTVYSKKDKENKEPLHKPFTDDEINALWKNSDDDAAAVTLIMIYTGVRISELLNLKKADIHLSEQWFHVTKSKTAAGVRDVPTADKIVPLFERFISRSGEYLITDSGKKLTYSDGQFMFFYQIFIFSILQECFFVFSL